MKNRQNRTACSKKCRHIFTCTRDEVSYEKKYYWKIHLCSKRNWITRWYTMLWGDTMQTVRSAQNVT